jgi:hypothetical protein
MHLIAPDILEEARGLSPAVAGTGLAIGLFLLLFGWRWHRFWTVVADTIAGGLYGLSTGQAQGGHVIILGIMVALAAGLLALELARIFAFVAGGMAVWLAAGGLFPKAQELWIAFLAGGLAGVLFYRLWTMVLTSFIGSLVAGHSGLVLAHSTSKFDSITWARQNDFALSLGVLALSVVGVLLQGAQDRWRRLREKKREEEERGDEEVRGWLGRKTRRSKQDLSREVAVLREVLSKPDR